MYIDLMHKSQSGPCILGNRNLRIVIGHSSREVTKCVNSRFLGYTVRITTYA